MPMYDYECAACNLRQAVFKRMADYQLPEACPTCDQQMVKVITPPAILGDYPGYSCPITGKWIEGRRAHLENLRLHGCRVLEAGEREEVEQAKRREDAELEAAIGKTVDETISRMPARKRESLAAELDGGLDVKIVRN